MEVLNVPTEAPVSELSKTAPLAHIIAPIEQNRIGGGNRGRNDSEVEEVGDFVAVNGISFEVRVGEIFSRSSLR